MGKTLYVSDLDGTLLNKNKVISCRSIQILNELIDDGMAFTIATARSYHSCQKMLEPLNLAYPVILYNGALIYDTEDKVALHWEFFEQEEARRYLDWIRESGISPLVYRVVNHKEQVSWQTTTAPIVAYLASRQGDTRFFQVASFDELYHGRIFYLTMMGTQAALSPLYRRFKDEKQIQVVFSEEIDRPGEYWLEIMPKSASKQNGVCYLKDRYGFERVVSFGDSLNDLSLFAASDEGYALSNAHDLLKQQATGIIGHHDEDGVALYLKQHWLE